MIYTFKSRAAADLKMTGPVGDRVLSLIGKTPSPQGIIDIDQIPDALRALEAAVAAESPRDANDDDDDENDRQRGTPRAEDHVSLRQRVWPLVLMLKASLDERQPVVWGV
jgi:cyclopropane-fatty-acyl-phospholipid synthase